jgi:hypothetical protein
MPRLIALLIAWLAMSAAGLCQDLPGNKPDRAFDAAMQTFNLDNPSWAFIYKTGKHQGSSIGFHVAEQGGRKGGSFLPFNSSSDPEAEVVNYRLARMLGVSDTYNPVTYYQLGPVATARFKALLAKHVESDPDRSANYNRIAAQLKANPKTIFGIYRLRPKGNKVAVNSLGMGGQFNQSSAMATYIRASGPLPSERLISLPEVKAAQPGSPKPVETELELARQLSAIFVLDQLTGQWDRFWRNLEATSDRTGRVRFLARDNGGATLDEWEGEWHASYERWVSRYDPDVMRKLQNLSAFLNKTQPAFETFSDVEKWKAAAGFRKVGSYTMFKRKLNLLIDKRLPMLEKQYGAKVYFPPSLPMAQAAPMAPIEAKPSAPVALKPSEVKRAVVVPPVHSP